MKVTGINATKLSVKNQMVEIESTHLDRKSALLLQELIRKTPVDTGEARAGWALSKIAKNRVVITNSADHIEYLNEGSSKQAPEFFIERAAIQYGTPLGTIVEKVK